MKKYNLKPSIVPKQSIDYSSHLNPEQLAAVTAGDGPALVIAGAGSGKTRVVTYRVAYLIEHGITPSRIMLLTFTNKAAREMLQRVEMLVKTDARRVWGGTFHHLGNIILRKYGETINLDPNFTILDRDDSKSLVESCIADLNLRKDKMFPKGKVVLNIISHSTGTIRHVREEIEEHYDYLEVYSEEIERVCEIYNAKKRNMNLVDFDDLLVLWRKILIESPSIKEKLSDRFLYVLVD